MILRRANIYDSNDIAKVHVDVWTSFYESRVSEEFLNFYDLENRKKFWLKFIGEGRIAFVVEEKGGGIDGVIVPRLKRASQTENIGEILMQFVNSNEDYDLNRTALVIACAKLFEKNNANKMYTWVHRESDLLDFYRNLNGEEKDAKVERLDGKDIIKIKIEWDDVSKFIKDYEAELDKLIVEF